MTIILGTLAIIIVTVGIGLLLDRKFGLLASPETLESDKDRARKKLATHGAGDAAATALRISDAQIAKLRTSQHCANCRALMQGEPDDTVRYDQADLLVLHFACPSCAAKRSIYIEHLSR